MTFVNPIASRCWTREMAASSFKETPENTFPKFDLSRIKSLMPGYHIWDAWFVLNEEDSQLSDIFGYKVLIALGRPFDSTKTRMMYFISADGVHYKPCGPLFQEGNPYIDKELEGEGKLLPDAEEWSGCSIFREGRYIQTFYTLASSYHYNGIWQKQQQIASVTQSLFFVPPFSDTADYGFDFKKIKKGRENFFLKVIKHNIISTPRSYSLYQNAENASIFEEEHPNQHNWQEGNDQVNNFCYRDPKFIKVKGSTSESYLLFEANTGNKTDKWTENKITGEGCYNQAFIGSHSYAKQDILTPDAAKANACIGMLGLYNGEPPQSFEGTKARYMLSTREFSPIFYANFVTDEIERINIIEHHGYYYLFFVVHSNKMAFSNQEMVNRDMMIGFKSKQPAAAYNDTANIGKLINTLYLYKAEWIPLNGNGVVIQQKSPGARFSGQDQNPQYVYSWMVLPDLTVLCYSNFSSDEHGNAQPVKTMGPSVQLEINDSTTRIISDPIYNFQPMP